MSTPKPTESERLPAAWFGLSLGRYAVAGVAVAALFGVLYASIFAGLVRQWWNDPNYGHGFLVPLAAFYLGWQKRERLAALGLRPTLWGLGVLAGSQALLLVGALGAELFLQRVSFVLLVLGSLLFLYGWGHARALAFPFFLLFFMIPLPAILFNAVAVPLQLTASRWAETLIQLFQVPVVREGNILILAHQSLNVTEACSGIRSLVSLVTLALLVAYFLPVSVWLRGLLVVSALPITLLTNSLRVAGTGLLGHFWSPEAAEGFFHIFSGWVIFLLALALLFGEWALLERWRRWREKRKEVE